MVCSVSVCISIICTNFTNYIVKICLLTVAVWGQLMIIYYLQPVGIMDHGTILTTQIVKLQMNQSNHLQTQFWYKFTDSHL